MSEHTLSHASSLFSGNSVTPDTARRGIPFHPVTLVELGAPVAIVTTALISAATSTELPNAATKTYTFPSAGASPQDGSLGLTGTLDVARNIVVTMTHATSLVACTVLVTGKDVYHQAMTELFTITATGTTKTATGKKAFKQITAIAITSAGDATANTANIGFGDSLGLPYNLKNLNRALFLIDGVVQTTLGTVAPAVTTSPATNVTGDVRGTWLPNSATDATRTYAIWMANIPNAVGKDNADCAFGVAQA
jgi:hypothetical protein